MKQAFKLSFIFLAIVLITGNCGDDGKLIDPDRGIILISINEEKTLGWQLDSTIRATPADFPILDRSLHAQAYAFMDEIFDDIINNTGEPLKYKDDFQWKLTIIEKDELNAFAAPGGYLYFYTGLLKYLDKTSEVAGVLGHEMAHADLRHSARQMQKAYGVNLLLNIILGTDKSQLEQIVAEISAGLASLKFSRDDEHQSDEFSVKYLAGTPAQSSEYDCKYDPRGVAGFFEKLEAAGTAEPPQILSTHPSGENRVEEVTQVWTNLGSPVGEIDPLSLDYASFKALLP
jgi:predicted Zn-dependent protease